MNEWLNKIEQELAEALQENDFEAFVSQCKALWKFVYNFAFRWLSLRIIDADIEEIADAAMLEVIEEIRRAATKGRFRLNAEGKPEAHFVSTGKWAPFRKWLIGVVRKVCKRILRDELRRRIIYISPDEVIGEDEDGHQITLGDTLPARSIKPATKDIAEAVLQNWVSGIVTDLWEFAESLEEGRMWEVAIALINFIREKISEFTSPRLPDEQWRELNFEELLEQADMFEFGKDLVADSGTLAFKTKDIWDWIQQELRDKRGKPLSRNNRDKLKERFMEALHKLLFSIDIAFQGELDNDNKRPSEDLRQAFRENEIILSQNATVSIKKSGSRWLITDEDNGEEYIVWKKKDEINIYKTTVRLENLRKAGLI